VRYGQASEDTGALLDAQRIIKAIHPAFMKRRRDGTPEGVYWKLNADLTVIPGMEATSPNDDALSGWLVYSLVRQALVSSRGAAAVVPLLGIQPRRSTGGFPRLPMSYRLDGYGCPLVL
jgi:hypothetical protein